ERLVLRLEPHVVGLLEEALDGGLLAHERHDYLPIPGGVLGSNDHVVAVEDAGVLHRLARHAQHVVAVIASGDLRHLHVFLDVLLGEDGGTRGDPTDHWQPAWPDRLARRLTKKLERARLGWVAPK